MSDVSNVLTVQPNGPNVITGDLVIAMPSRARVMQTAFLCRCGHSSDKPFCDGTHVKTGFSDAARLPVTVEAGATGVGKVTITPKENGPNRCEGPLTLRDVDGRISVSNSTFLCRCGGSHNKPFCDGTHKRIGFKG
jgi:CDGSH-type Zn-finger protein